ncbi:MAG: glycosyltransferase family 39 protein [Leadbetterella sp.]|nr:glycosyltransferase family 39 protein [Leadbetterella sp.]
MESKGYRIIFFISCALILLLAGVNGGFANDDHFTVIELIARFGTFPESQQCWQCYHPKLYHGIIAVIWNLFGITSPFYQHLSAQLFNALAGCATVFIFLRFIRSLDFSENVKLLVFAFFAFNPRLIAISAQATNDALIIFLGTLNIYCIYRLFEKPSLKFSLLLILSVVLGAMTKLNFGVFLIASLLALLLLSFSRKNFRLSLVKGYLGAAVLTAVISTYAFLSFNGYLKNYREHGTLFTYNTPTYDLPHLYKLDDEYIPGIRSIYSGYFKFYYFDLVKNPMVTYESGVFRKHLTSHFSQLYGRTHFYTLTTGHPEWQTQSIVMRTIGSITLAIAILPVFILVLGLIILLIRFVPGFLKKTGTDPTWISFLYIAGFLGFSVLFSMMGRNFTFMKAIYIFPGLLATVIPFCTGNTAVMKIRGAGNILTAFYIFLFILYLIPVIHLIVQLGQKL